MTEIKIPAHHKRPYRAKGAFVVDANGLAICTADTDYGRMIAAALNALPKVYAIATKTSQTYGHGDSGDELHICSKGAYGQGGFHPVFPTTEAAARYRAALVKERPWVQLEVVELTVAPECRRTGGCINPEHCAKVHECQDAPLPAGPPPVVPN